MKVIDTRIINEVNVYVQHFFYKERDSNVAATYEIDRIIVNSLPILSLLKVKGNDECISHYFNILWDFLL